MKRSFKILMDIAPLFFSMTIVLVLLSHSYILQSALQPFYITAVQGTFCENISFQLSGMIVTCNCNMFRLY
jgi:hypothetical protein